MIVGLDAVTARYGRGPDVLRRIDLLLDRGDFLEFVALLSEQGRFDLEAIADAWGGDESAVTAPER